MVELFNGKLSFKGSGSGRPSFPERSFLANNSSKPKKKGQDPCIYLGKETGNTFKQGCGASATILTENICNHPIRSHDFTKQALCVPNWKSGCTSALGRAIPCNQCSLYTNMKIIALLFGESQTYKWCVKVLENSIVKNSSSCEFEL